MFSSLRRRAWLVAAAVLAGPLGVLLTTNAALAASENWPIRPLP